MKILFLSLAALAIQVHERPSFQNLLKGLKSESEIPSVFKNATAKKSELQKLLKTNASLLKKWETLCDDSAAFARGEIEDEQVLNKLVLLVQLELLKSRNAADDPRNQQLILARLFNFSADLAYEESSLVGLRLAHVIRSLALDEIERIESQNKAVWLAESAALKWAEKLRAPWPIDRVVLSESKKVLGQREMVLAEKVMRSLQKNAYETTEILIKKHAGGSKSLAFLVPMWRDTDIEMMKTEVQRLTSVKVRVASRIFKKTQGAQPANIDDLVKSKLLAAVPINYETGRPMTLSEAQLPLQNIRDF